MAPAGKRQRGVDGHDDDDQELDEIWNNDSSVPIRPAHPADLSTTSTDNESLEKSENAEVLRGLAGAPGSDEVSLPDSIALDTTTKTTTGLPSAADMFDQVREAPAYLRPEITGLSKDINDDADNALNTVAQSNVALPIKSKGQKQRQGWDVSMMAPKLHSPEPSHTTISSKPISFDHNHSPSRQGTQAMTVEEFLEKGVGGAQLPRKRQERKDKEKQKRMKGQSSHANWKTEAEMALRQQYD